MMIDAALVPFFARLAGDASLRDALVAWVDEQIATENTLDRVDATHSLDYQRGRVAVLRSLRTKITALERPKET
jgi:hypothetical protein